MNLTPEQSVSPSSPAVTAGRGGSGAAAPSSAGPTSKGSGKSQRVLACVLCQQRKVKCDRKFPCANCRRADAQCVPSTLATPQRRGRLLERELLERVRYYEGLLREHNIPFDPLRKFAAEKNATSGLTSSSRGEGGSSDQMLPPRTVKSETRYEVKDLWEAIYRRPSALGSDEDDDDEDANDEDDDDDYTPHTTIEQTVKTAMDEIYERTEHLLVGTEKTDADLSTLHPGQAQIFRLWQVYLDNVNPLLKVTHTPTLQTRIIDAAGNLSSIPAPLEALMFSIYCSAVNSMESDDCMTTFGSPKKDLLASYRFGCQQALLNCEILRSSDQDSLTAFFLYLVSVQRAVHPRALATMLGVAVRIAHRLGINSEAANARCSLFEGEMRRRLWWSLVVFDSRICEMSDAKSSTLGPTWNCAIPANVNDSDIRPEMTAFPASHDSPTESIFVVVRSELGNFVRKSGAHLDFTNPSLKRLTKNIQTDLPREEADIAALQNRLETTYLQSCNIENPLHLLTYWIARGQFAKSRLLTYYSAFMEPSNRPTDQQRNQAVQCAIEMMRCNTKLLVPLTKGYFWLVNLNFPFPAWMHMLHDVRKRPLESHVEDCWTVMSDNYMARFKYDDSFGEMPPEKNPIFKVFARLILQAWRACETARQQIGQQPLTLPPMVQDLSTFLEGLTPNTANIILEPTPPADPHAMQIDTHANMPTAMPIMAPDSSAMGTTNLPYSWWFPGMAGPANAPAPNSNLLSDSEVAQIDWSTVDWNPLHTQNW